MASIRTLASTGTLFIDFRYEGKRCREYTRLEDTPANRKKLMRLVQRLETDLAAGTFDYASFFPGSKKNSKAHGGRVEAQAVVTVAPPLPAAMPIGAPFAAGLGG
ncbi:Arm DNA-binding domain-containing protein [Thauera humireducens]|uniref:Arm DNA-binding domain-containing protein n=1 Tax=Thauera humireducens TaxID=1134435 RepID=UPI0009ED873E|nr:DUF3596 domain-containing protein [Thauera humireducens]